MKASETAKRAPRKAPPKSVTEAAASGDHRAMLVALQARIARAIDSPDTPARELAALSKQWRDIGADIQVIDDAGGTATSGRGPRLTAVADTANEAWDESKI